ncbi:MAG: hypothetical protein M1593_04600 [Candidatus Thermoplasmatota archaeon]|nr:hypothetical protein [Candidatus Thermoplasmatota archaeon]MCL5668285.1 hypothetical protein [Candidatus Thermoplasmatota archaeon]
MESRALGTGLNLLAFSPAILIYVYTFPYFYANINLAVLVLIAALPIVKLLVPKRYSSSVYPVALIIAMLLVIATLFYLISPSRYYYLEIFSIPIALSTFFAIDFAFAFIFIFEGLLSKRSSRMIGYLFLSLGTMLYELSIIAAMHEFSLTFMNALSLVFSLEILSYYELFVYGYQKFLPMANFQIQINQELLVLFIVSTIAIVFSIYLRENGHQRERLGDLANSLFAGSIMGTLLFAVYDYFSYTQYQLSIIGFGVFATFIAISRTSRKEKNRKPKIK